MFAFLNLYLITSSPLFVGLFVDLFEPGGILILVPLLHGKEMLVTCPTERQLQTLDDHG